MTKPALQRHFKIMASHSFLRILPIVYTLFIFITARSTSMAASRLPPVVKAGYYPSWVMDDLPPSAINTSLLTHVLYAFLVPNNVTFGFDISDSTAMILSNFTTTLHQKNRHVKVLYSIGGGDIEPDPFAAMAAKASSRQVFIDATIGVARKYGFDGFDLDWEFPESPKAMNDFALLLEEWRQAIRKEAKMTNRSPLLLTAAVYYSAEFLVYGSRRSYPAAAVRNNLDWVNVMCYDYHGSWDTSATGAHAALFDPQTNLSSVYGLKSWIQAGVPGNKLVMGLAFYGKTWNLKDPNSHGVGAPPMGVGRGFLGVLTFSQVMHFNNRTKATVAYDVDTVSAYSYTGASWVGYDDALSTTGKILLAQALGLRGYFIWALSFDKEWTITAQASRSWILDK